MSVPHTAQCTGQSTSGTPLDSLLQRPAATLAPPQGSVMLATLIAFDGSQATLSLPGAQPITAASLVPLQAADIGRTAAITLHGDSQALVLGLIWKAEPATTTLHDVIVDGQHVSIEAKESITLACGRASVTLTADGQILLRGDYISNHSTGTQRIKGAAVQIN